MVLPTEIENLARKHGMADQHLCEGAKFHSPRPLKVRAYVLSNSQRIFLCGTCRDNLSMYLFLWDAENGLDWVAMRSFGNQIRHLAQKVMEAKR